LATARAAQRLQRRLNALGDAVEDYWSFKDDSERDLAHSLFQYPAMMVPRLQRVLLDEMLQAEPTARSVYDPYVGSGTVLTEAMLRGLSFGGVDVNPLAVLVSATKAGPFHHETFADEGRAVVAAARLDRSMRVEAAFPGLDKWFTPGVVRELSCLRRAIARRPELSVRRFLWVAMAETVRLTSNSRTSTVKLHMRTSEDIKRRQLLSAIDVFAQVSERNATSLREQANLLTERRLITKGHYHGEVLVRVGDARCPPDLSASSFDMVITSPPYGDNPTTVTYGQHSYLPLQWIDLLDIEEDIDADCVRSTHEIDFRGLGGSTRHALARVEPLRARSPALRNILIELANRPTDGAKRVGSFAADLDLSLDPTLRRLKRDGLMIWIVGNRRVNGVTVPTTKILTDLLGDRVEPVAHIDRPITGKRHAVRNSVAATMTHEAVLVFRKRRNGR
jgi:hypothetical protein